MRSSALSLLSAGLLISISPVYGASSKQQILSKRQYHEMIVKWHIRNMDGLNNFDKMSCVKALYSAQELVADLEQDKVQSEIDNGDSWALADSQNVATEYNGLALVAEHHGCDEFARHLYLKVIETYVGTAYEAMRQRAQIGIDDLRAKEASGPAKIHQPPP